jgi:hypothetical protein
VITASAAPALGGHLWHLLALGAWVPIFGLIVAVEQARARGRNMARPKLPARTTSGRPRSVQAMALGSVGAAVIHLAVTPEHFHESIWYGTFFLATASAQIVLATALLARPTRRLVAAGLAGSGLVVVLWLISRLVGVPIGPDNGSTESFGVLDSLATLAEVATVSAAVLTLRTWTAGLDRGRHRAADEFRAAVPSKL